jgi:hypothetical protein
MWHRKINKKKVKDWLGDHLAPAWFKGQAVRSWLFLPSCLSLP